MKVETAVLLASTFNDNAGESVARKSEAVFKFRNKISDPIENSTNLVLITKVLYSSQKVLDEHLHELKDSIERNGFEFIRVVLTTIPRSIVDC